MTARKLQASAFGGLRVAAEFLDSRAPGSPSVGVRSAGVRRVRALRARRQRGLSLLEVMVAVAILALGLVVVLGSQTGMFSGAQHAARLSVAVGLARCKMAEIEEEVLREGFQLTDEDGEGPCCVDDESEFGCEWSVETVELPELGMNLAGDAGAPDDPFDDPLGDPSGPDLSELSSARESFVGGNASDAFSGLSALSGAASGPSAGAGALAPMAMGLIYPELKAMLEASIRKAVVRVVWREGRIERDLEVMQYLTNPQQGGFADLLGEELPGAGQAGAASSGGAAASGSRGNSASPQ